MATDVMFLMFTQSVDQQTFASPHVRREWTSCLIGSYRRNTALPLPVHEKKKEEAKEAFAAQ